MKSFTSRTTLITALAVAGVLVAGTAAIAANIGILNSTDDSSIGSLSATDDLIETTSTTGVPTTIATTTTSLPDSPADAGGSYVVDDAGVVTLSTSGGLTLVSAAPEAGWTVTSSQPAPTSLEVTFTNGVRTLVFSAVLGSDGVVTADVVEPIDVLGAPAATPATSSPSTSSPTTTIDDDHFDDDHDDDFDDDDHDDDDDDRYDDDHEYEGADDDD